MRNYLPDKLKSTENREHFKSMLKDTPVIQTLFHLLRKHLLIAIRPKIYFFRKVMHNFITFLFGLLDC